MTKTDGKKVASADSKISSRVNPYVGPRPYLPGEELFGRDREKRDLLDQLLAERIVLLHSPSGAGKSSLVNAGLIPMLRKEGLQDLPVVRVGEEPNLEYASQDGFNRFTYSMLLSLEGDLTPDELDDSKGLSEVKSADQEAHRKARLDELARMSLKSYLVQRRQKLDSDLNVLIFDQFEEIITTAPTDNQGKQVFFSHLGDLLSDRSLWALFVIRDDFLGAVEPFALSIPTQLSNTFRLDLLKSHAAQQAIQEPVASQGITFLESAAQKLVDDLRVVQTQDSSGEIVERLGIYVEPVQLQVVCLRLYDQLDLINRLEKTQIDDEDIKKVGDVSAALASYYAERVTATAESHVVERQVRDWFDEKLITKSGLRSQVMMEVGASGGLDNTVIRQLEKAHLVRAEKRRGVTWFELAHDRLVRPVQKDNERWRGKYLSPWQLRAIEWQKNGEPENLLLRGNSLDEYREWVEEHPLELSEIDSKYLQSSLKWRETRLSPLQRKAAEWDSLGRPEHLLSGGEALQEDSNWALANTDEITSRELEYLEASREVEREAVERERRLKLEAAEQVAEAERLRAEEQASAAVRLRRLAYILGAVLVIAIILAGFALDKTAEAENQANISRALKLTIWVSSLLDQKLDLALLLGIEGYRLKDLSQTRQALNDALRHNPQLSLFLSVHTAGVKSVAWSPNGRLASGSDDGNVILWELEGRQPEVTLEGHSGGVNSLAWSPDGRLASASDDGSIIVWDLENASPWVTLEGHTDRVNSVAWSPDGRLASGSCGELDEFSNQCTQGEIIIWDLVSGQPEMTLEVHTDWVNSVAWSPYGRLASGLEDGTVILWDLESKEPLETLEGHTNRVNSVAWSPDGRLASGSEDGTVIVWSLERGEPEATLLEHTEGVRSVGWSTDGRLASGSEDGTVIVWDLVSGQLEMTLEGHTDWVNGVAWSPDGRLASGSNDATVIIWDLESGVTLKEHTRPVYSVAWSPEGRLASGSNDSNVIVWSLESGEPEVTLVEHPKGVRSVAWSTDGRLASGSEDGTVIVWDLVSGQPEMTLKEHTKPVYSVAWSPDGWLASASDDGNIIVWDLENASPWVTLEGHTDRVNSVAWSPDADEWLASGSSDRTIQVWPMDPQVWIEQGCQRAGRNFTQEEWAQYFPDDEEKYRKTCEQWP